MINNDIHLIQFVTKITLFVVLKTHRSLTIRSSDRKKNKRAKIW